MARVLAIDSGPLTPDDLFRDVPHEKWRDLLLVRRQFLKVRLSFDCRCLVNFIDEAESVFEELGFADAEDMVRNGYGLEPAEIALALEWLRLNEPTEPVPFDAARRMAVRTARDNPVRETGRPKKGTNIVPLSTGGNDRILARLASEHPEILADYEDGKFVSVRAAAVAAGIVKPPTPLTELHRAWKRASQVEREQFRKDIA